MRSIGKYRLLGLLGRGGMARVYKVFDPDTGRLMAMKVLKPGEMLQELLKEHELKRLFRAEARIMQEIDSEHVARILDTGEYCGWSFILQEYLCMNLALLMGEEAEAELPSRPLSPLVALDIASQILQGLESMHRARVVHRDIKPANILLNRSKQVRIIDFGLARVKDRIQKRTAGVIMGSPYYAAPEQENEPEQADHRADLYSLGVVLYRMVTGNLPEIHGFKGLDSDLLGPDWSRFLKTALAPEPDQRFPDARAMLAGLEKLKLDWETRREQVCSLPQNNKVAGPVKTLTLRSTPLRTGRKSIVFGGLNRLLQPESYIQNRLHILDYGILDASTSLVWAWDASREQANLEQARDFADSLNRNNRFTSPEHRWRLPTVEELVSLMQPRRSLEDYCAPDLWRLEGRYWLWSADTQNRDKAWIADMEQGAVLAQDRHCLFHVLPVRKAEKKELKSVVSA